MSVSGSPQEQAGGGVVTADGEATDWEAEVRGLGYMILTIASRYEMVHDHPAKRKRGQWKCPLGGDSELLHSVVMSAREYVDGPLREMLGPKAEKSQGNEPVADLGASEGFTTPPAPISPSPAPVGEAVTDG